MIDLEKLKFSRQAPDWNAWCFWQASGHSGSSEHWSGDLVRQDQGLAQGIGYRGFQEGEVQVSWKAEGIIEVAIIHLIGENIIEIVILFFFCFFFPDLCLQEVWFHEMASGCVYSDEAGREADTRRCLSTVQAREGTPPSMDEQTRLENCCHCIAWLQSFFCVLQ